MIYHIMVVLLNDVFITRFIDKLMILCSDNGMFVNLNNLNWDEVYDFMISMSCVYLNFDFISRICCKF